MTPLSPPSATRSPATELEPLPRGTRSPGGAELFAAFDRLRRKRPRALAILDAEDRSRTDRDGLARLVDGAGRAIARSGLAVAAAAGPKTVALQVANGPALLAAVLACWRDGIVPLPLDAEMPPAEVGRHLARLRLPGVVCGHRLVPEPAAGALAAAANSGRLALPADTALLRMTSGTTGEPRAVAASEASLFADVDQITSTMGIHERDRNLVAVPLSHCYGFDNVVLTLATLGCPAVIVRDLTPRHLLRAARHGRASVFPAVPFLVDLLARAPTGGSPRWPELRLVISAGAPLPVVTRERFAARYGVRPRVLYGSTECGGISFDRDGAADLAEGCVGVALEGVSVGLRDAVRGVGRLEVHSRAVATAFVPRATTAAGRVEEDDVLSDGHFLAPDLVRVDDRGRLHLLGRVSEVINVGGRKVFPAEVERVIRGIDGVRDVAVVGARRSTTSEAVRAVVVASPEVDRAAVIAGCTGVLASYKVPRVIDFVSEMPRNRRGKLDRRALAADRRERGS